jgi:predicted GH43/DUF377 family glycosyl hydrolase
MKPKKARVGTFLLSLLTLAILASLGFIFFRQTHHIAKLEKTIAKRQGADRVMMDQMATTLEQMMKTVGRTLTIFPLELKNVPCAWQMGVVEEVKLIEINSVFAPYNASIVEKDGGGYHLFFRYDEPKDLWKRGSFYSHIGYAELNDRFQVVDVLRKVDTGSNHSEDPRVVRVGNSYFLSWNDLVDESKKARSIHVGEWNSKKCKLEYVTDLQQCIKPVEKNWVPFERNVDGKPSLAFVYGIYPHKILGLQNPKYNEITHLMRKGYTALANINWSGLWGPLSGGTPPRLIGKEYITFFHSSFKDEDKKIWYVMGAYTFSATFPYEVTSVTPYPILFPGIYSSEIRNTADPAKNCIFPAGVAVEKQDERTLLHVSCGENDSNIKVVTIDYDKLRKIMTPVN